MQAPQKPSSVSVDDEDVLVVVTCWLSDWVCIDE